ncbi:unnamed protein product [Oppiella nova]|uniref:Uncharacterized protein n=1 Tax=Oppiella nova TaxID=334625 RepID=A0A7R9MIA2_9ACAR|nr:unnamed protein product [Oppiella nova]CAG2177764.1 unnamed protein product [Oppiella nova]
MKEIVEDHKKRKNDPTMSPTIMPSIDPEVVSNRSREMDARSSQVFDEEFTESNCDDSMHSNDFLALDYL